MRADPAGMPAAAGEIPAAGNPVAAGHRDRPRLVGRAPGHGRARVAPDLARRGEVHIGRDQPGAVGDRHAPGDRAVGPRQLLDRAYIGAGLDLVAADRARQQHAEEPRLMERVEEARRQPPGRFDRISGGKDRRGEVAGARQRVGWRAERSHVVHRVLPLFYRGHCGAGSERCQCTRTLPRRRCRQTACFVARIYSWGLPTITDSLVESHPRAKCCRGLTERRRLTG